MPTQPAIRTATGVLSNAQLSANSMKMQDIQRQMETIKSTQVLLAKIEIEQLKTLLRLLQEAVTGKPVS